MALLPVEEERRQNDENQKKRNQNSSSKYQKSIFFLSDFCHSKFRHSVERVDSNRNVTTDKCDILPGESTVAGIQQFLISVKKSSATKVE